MARGGIDHIATASRHEGHFGTPKTRSSFRKIPIGESLEANFVRLRDKKAIVDDLVFASKAGTALRPENVLKRVIRPACERLGLPKVGWHDLRHASATLLHEHEPLRVAQAILGHSDLQTTLVYTHVLPGSQREAMRRLERGIMFPYVPKSDDEPKIRDAVIQCRVRI